jgi:SAM-dependent methyltransferase
VAFDDPLRTEPVSRLFGAERGLSIDRYYIEKFLARNANLIRGQLLEIASSDYSRKFESGATSYGVLHVEAGHPETTVVGDLARPEALPEAVCDVFICTQTFNFIFDLAGAVRGACRLLKPGGVLLATVAGLTQISRYDMDRWGDFWRFTDASAKRLFASQFETLSVHPYGNVLAAKALLDGLAVSDLPNPQLLDQTDPDYQVLIGIVARKAT